MPGDFSDFAEDFSYMVNVDDDDRDGIESRLQEIGVNAPLKVGDHYTTALILAIEAGRKDLAIKLLEYGANPDARDGEGVTPLYRATQLRMDLSRNLAKHGSRGTIAIKQNDFLQSPLHYAARHGHDDIIQSLVIAMAELGGRRVTDVKFNYEDFKGIFDPNSVENGKTMLHLAAENGHLSFVKLLIEQCGASTLLKDENGKNALQMALANGHEDLAVYLMKEMLKEAARENTNGIADEIDEFSDLEDGETMLHRAATRGWLKTARFLVDECGAKINPTNRAGQTAIHLAKENGHEEIAAFLMDRIMKKGADHGYRGAIFTAAKFGYVEILEKLKGQGVELKISLRDGMTPLQRATEFGQLEAVAFLAKNVQEMIYVAAKHDGSRVMARIDAFLEDGKDPIEVLNGPVKGDAPAAYIAAQYNQVRVMEVLFARGVNLDPLVTLAGHKPATPLALAASLGHVEVVKFLLEQKDVDIEGRGGLSPLKVTTKAIAREEDPEIKARKESVLELLTQKIAERDAAVAEPGPYVESPRAGAAADDRGSAAGKRYGDSH